MRPILLSILCFGALQGVAMSQDYLAPDLRTAVEALKADVAREATSNETARDRARVMWQWANAFALSERFIPVNVTAITNAIMAILPEDPVPPRLMKGLDDFIREFRVRDEQPDAIGSVSLDSEGPFKAESLQSIALTYTVGSLAIEEGGRVVLARNFLSDSGMWQYNDPGGDNFVSIRSSNPLVKFSKDEVQIQGMHGGFRRAAPQLAYRIETGTLSEGDTFTITYGDKSGGGSGYRIVP